MLVYCMPILVSFLAHFVLGEKLTFLKTIGLCSGMLGLLFVMGLHIFSLENEKILFGQILIVLSAVCWALANIYSKVKFASYDKTKMTAWQMGIGSSILLFISLFFEQNMHIQWTWTTAWVLLFSGFFSSAVAFVAWFWILGQIEVSAASMTLMLVPVLGVLLGWLHLGEEITVYMLLGAVFICLGIYLVSYNPKNKMKIGINKPNTL